MHLPNHGREAPTRIKRTQPTEQVTQSSRFGDSSWDLSEFFYRKHEHAHRAILQFNFDLPDGSLLTDSSNTTILNSTKEYLLARFRGLPPAFKAMKVGTIRGEYLCLRTLIEWMNVRGKKAYSQLSRHDIEVSYLAHLRKGPASEPNKKSRSNHSSPRSDERLAVCLTPVQRLWDYREVMCDSLTFNPFNGRSPYSLLGVTRDKLGENRTPIIPDEVMAKLVEVALTYVYTYSADIIRARSLIELLCVQLKTERRKGTFASRNNATGVTRDGTFYRRTEATLSTVAISVSPDTGKPWRPPFSTTYELYQEEQHLFTACYILIAWLTGMRNGEITSLLEGCVSRERSEDGLIERVKIKGTLFKGVPDPRGRSESWISIEPAARAIEVLAELTHWLRIKKNAQELFLFGYYRVRNINVASSSIINKKLNEFALHAGVPQVDGKTWKLTTRQFRRTLARWLARRPFGEIAGMIQFKQVLLASFEGYVGTDKEFLKTLTEENILASIDLLEELRGDFLDGLAAGPKAPDLISTFKGIAGDRRGDDELYMLKHLARTLFVGTVNLCFYDPAFAMCQQHIPVTDRKMPVTSHCHPEACPNSCITKQHLPVWEGQLGDIDKLLSRPKIPHLQRLALEQEQQMIVHIIAPFRGQTRIK